MAFLATSDDPQLPVFYNVSAAVGAGAYNADDDVSLVQYFLIMIYSTKPLKTSHNTVLNWSRPQGDLQVDGVFGPITQNWILKFQRDALQLSPIRVDGRVDRCLSQPPGGFVGHVTSSISQTLYTICALNKLFIVNFPDLWDLLSSGTPITADSLAS